MAADKKKAAKAAPKKAAAKAAPKKAAAKAAPKAAAKPTPVKERWSKTQILNEISERVEISRKHVGAVMSELEGIIARHTGQRRGNARERLNTLLEEFHLQSLAERFA